MPPPRTRGVNDRIDDPVGTGVALLVGTLLGLALAAPLLPRSVPAAEVALGPVGARLFLAMVAVTAVPLCLFSLYLLVAETDG